MDKKKRIKRSQPRWNIKNIDQHNALVRQIANSVIQGDRPSKLDWYKFDTGVKRSDAATAKPVGPGSYEPPKGIGQQVVSHRKSAPAFGFGQAESTASVHVQRLSSGTYRVKSNPKDVTITPYSQRRGMNKLHCFAGSCNHCVVHEEFIPPVGYSASSRHSSAPLFSMSGRTPLPSSHTPAATGNTAPVPSGFGRQLDRPNAGTVPFSRGEWLQLAT